MNRTVMECARSMRLHAGLPLEFWVEAMNTAVYLVNRSPSTVLNKKILEEAWTGKKVNYGYLLKVFGWEAFMHIDSAQRTKLGAKSKKCFLVRYTGKGTSDTGCGILKRRSYTDPQMLFSMNRSWTRIVFLTRQV